ncbi:unnamed protein product [Sphagnum jensenii]|uniref:Uncharacterized protein n=1 Tax=Sphagnum jensenii TaxID=128206 RepID=A0ABP0XHP3_9BRYO
MRDATVPRFNPPAEPAWTVGFRKRDSTQTVRQTDRQILYGRIGSDRRPFYNFNQRSLEQGFGNGGIGVAPLLQQQNNVQNEFLQEENEILKQKLEIHMNLWDLDKQQMESDFFAAMQVHKRKASAQTYEKAKLKVSHGLQQQQEFVMKLKLEAALENVEVLQTKVKFFTALLQDSKGGRGTTTMTTEQRGCIQVVETSKENDVDEAKQRIEHLEQSLKAAIEIHKLEVEALRAESLAEATEKETQQRVSSQ